jgi:hypothetical protein
VRPYLEKPFTKIGLVEWLKVKALSSTPSTAKKKKKKKKSTQNRGGRMGQVVEHLPSKCEALSSNCSITNKNKMKVITLLLRNKSLSEKKIWKI